MIEYKGFFSTVNRLTHGDYIGVVAGLHTGGIEIHATSICLLRKKFEAVVDEFLLTALPRQANAMIYSELNKRSN